ncbi:MAG: hypothetical protein OXL38_21430 [Gammaproteobacteria bacterium]|nr:hypothetical protein [Gammaproteobacteria bacterium]MDE0444654.1 hypothetical protein [Gammaproteobacteria bacterium]
MDPPEFPEIEGDRPSESRELVVVHVGRGTSSPYQYRGASYRRVGNTTRAMLADVQSRMLFERMHAERRWECDRPPEWTLQDLDLREFAEGGH